MRKTRGGEVKDQEGKRLIKFNERQLRYIVTVRNFVSNRSRLDVKIRLILRVIVRVIKHCIQEKQCWSLHE
jgi:hypothetical protein